MIVTCESCSSRYKVDDGKVSGRGARITCPKCKHQFVVYAAKPDAQKPGIKPIGMEDWANEEPTRVGTALRRPDGAGVTGVFPTGAPPPAPSEDDGDWAEPRSPVVKPPETRNLTGVSTPPAPRPSVEMYGRPPAPTPSVSPPRAPEPTPINPGRPIGRAPESPLPPRPAPSTTPEPAADESVSGVFVRATGAPVSDPYEVGVPAASSGVSVADAAARAPTLDFRKVGVMHWKVKVKIGLTYDFSDLKTLRKYIADGRVTPSDNISYNGRDWRAIGDIPDLDVFFVETYDRLTSEQASRPADEQGPPQPARTIPPTPLSSLGPDSDPYAPLRQTKKLSKDGNRQKSGRTTSTVPVKPPESRSAQIWVALLLIALVVAGGIWWSMQGSRPVTTKTPAPRPGASTGVDPTTRAVETPKSLPPGLNIVDEPVVQRPEDLRKPIAPPQGAGTQTPTNPGKGPSGGSSPPPSAPKASTSGDHAQVGDQAARSGDWGSAAKAYAKAAAAEPKNANYAAKLGNALYKSGNLDEAVGALKSATRLGSSEAYKTLGYVLRDLGDNAGAITAWTTYLKSSPGDAEIEKQLKALNGG